MTFKSHDNKFLRVKPGVVITEHIDPVICELDKYFETANLISYVTSGLRDSAAQLRIIRNALTQKGLGDAYPEAYEDIGMQMQYEGEEVYGWQPGWSKLLSVGYVVNPPYPAKCLMDYIRPGSTVNKKGTIIGASPHAHGTAFDIGGGSNGITNEAGIIAEAVGKVNGLKGYLLERNNNAIHCDCQTIDMSVLNK